MTEKNDNIPTYRSPTTADLEYHKIGKVLEMLEFPDQNLAFLISEYHNDYGTNIDCYTWHFDPDQNDFDLQYQSCISERYDMGREVNLKSFRKKFGKQYDKTNHSDRLKLIKICLAHGLNLENNKYQRKIDKHQSEIDEYQDLFDNNSNLIGICENYSS